MDDTGYLTAVTGQAGPLLLLWISQEETKHVGKPSQFALESKTVFKQVTLVSEVEDALPETQ